MVLRWCCNSVNFLLKQAYNTHHHSTTLIFDAMTRQSIQHMSKYMIHVTYMRWVMLWLWAYTTIGSGSVWARPNETPIQENTIWFEKGERRREEEPPKTLPFQRKKLELDCPQNISQLGISFFSHDLDFLDWIHSSGIWGFRTSLVYFLLWGSDLLKWMLCQWFNSSLYQGNKPNPRKIKK